MINVTKYSGKCAEFWCDSVDDIPDLPTMTKEGTGNFDYHQTAARGSTAIVGAEGSGISVYALFDFGWQEI